MFTLSYLVLQDRQEETLEKRVYADWTGAALPPAWLIDASHDRLRTTVLGNPHSDHTPSRAATELIAQTRMDILAYVRADPDEYDVIFTANATAAIRLLCHYFPWGLSSGELLLTEDNHNSVNGLRECVRERQGVVRYAPLHSDLTLDADALLQQLHWPNPKSAHKLFVYPLKSNWSGIVHDQNWIKKAQDHGWKVLVDAAAYMTNDRLDMRLVKPEFVAVSFYKMFGFPTGVGCLIIRRDAYAYLRRNDFSGGTVRFVGVGLPRHISQPNGHAIFEDGTLNFQMIPCVTDGLHFRSELGNVKPRVLEVAGYWRNALVEIHEGNARTVVYTPEGTDIVTFNITHDDTYVDPWIFGREAAKVGICLRAGCFCNPGCSERAFGYHLNQEQWLTLNSHPSEEVGPELLRRLIGNTRPVGAIRTSFGYGSTREDADALITFTRSFLRGL